MFVRLLLHTLLILGAASALRCDARADEWDAVDFDRAALAIDIGPDGRLTGPGADRLAEWMTDSQFLALGEQHGLRQVPRFVTAAFRTWYPQGWRHLALELEPWLTQQLSRGSVDGVLRQWPYALAFDEDSYIAMLRDIREHSATDSSRSDVFRGLDQPVTAIHALDRLSRILPDAGARQVARGLFLKAALQGGEYLRHDHEQELQSLRDLCHQELDQEADLLLSSLINSMRIYVAWRARRDGRPTEINSDELREQTMIARLSDWLTELEASTGEPPRVLLYMGGAHLMEGVGPNGVLTVGEFVQQQAAANGSDAVHLSLRTLQPESPVPEAIFRNNREFVLLDARVLRADLPQQPTSPESARLVRDLQQFDAIVYVRDGDSSPHHVIRSYERAFRNRILASLAPMAGAMLVILTLIGPLMLVPALRRLRGADQVLSVPLSPWLITAAIGVGWSLLAVQQIVMLRRAGRAALGTPPSDMLPDLTVAALALATVFLVGLAVRRRWWTVTQRAHFLIVNAAVLVLLACSHYWNLGGMPG